MQEHKDEKLIDIKGTFKQFIEEDKIELSPEEEIMKYEEKKNKKSDNDNDTTENEEHLKRIKQELLASLKRVEKLEEQLFKNHEEKLKLNVKDSKNGGFTSSKSRNQKESQIEKQNQKERE